MILDCYEYYLWTTRHLRKSKVKQKQKLKEGIENEQ